MNFSLWAIKRPAAILLLFIVLIVLGLKGFKAISIQDMPDIDLPTVTVSVGLPGATALQVEKEVTRKIEDSVASLGKIKHITSTITEGSSTTRVEFELDKNTQEAVDDVKDAVSQIKSNLPSDVTDPQIAKVKGGSRPLLTYAVSSKSLSTADLSWFVDDSVFKALLSVKDVSTVTRIGGVTRNVKVQLDPTKLNTYGVTAAQVYSQLKAYTAQTPAGQFEQNTSKSVTAYATLNSIADLEKVTISVGTLQIPLKDVASVEISTEKQYQKALLNGTEVVSFQIVRITGASDVEVASNIRAKIEQLNKSNPNLHIYEIFNNVDRVKSSYEGSMKALYEGALLAVIVVWLFLKNIRATIVAAVALPLSIIPSFWFMYEFFGLSLNGLTLLAITLVVGILVDDAIVEIENIDRHIAEGKDPYNAAIEAADEIGLAVIATTFTLIAVFLPTAFMDGIAGKFFKQFGLTASIAVFMSLVVARLLTPLMAAYVMKKSNNHYDPKTSKVGSLYLKTVEWTTHNRKKTISLAILFFLSSLLMISRINTEFIPSSDVSQITLTAGLAPGSSLKTAQATEASIREAVKSIKEIKSIYSTVGTTSESREIVTVFTLLPEKDRLKKQKDIEALITLKLRQIPSITYSLGAGRSGEKYSITLAGSDAQALSKAATKVIDEMKSIPGLGAVVSSANLKKPEIRLNIDYAKAARLGVSAQSIGQTIKIALSGDTSTALSKMDWQGQRLPIRVELNENFTKDLNNIKSIKVQGNTGLIDLQEVAEISLDSTLSAISKYDRLQNVTITADLNGKKLGEISKVIDNKVPTLKNLPAGIQQVPSGDSERMKELFSNFGGAMIAGVLCVYIVLVLLFHNVWHPLTILMALPLSFAGAFGLLYAVNYSMSLPVLIGLLMLMGIVTKNSILLVEYALVAMSKGSSPKDAVIMACEKRSRPIIMTTAAMIVGMVPLALGWDGDPSFKSPMAVAVIGGLITSTFLSLLVIPAVFLEIEQLVNKIKAIFNK